MIWFYYDFMTEAMYSRPPLGYGTGTFTVCWFDLLDYWGDMEEEWEYVTDEVWDIFMGGLRVGPPLGPPPF